MSCHSVARPGWRTSDRYGSRSITPDVSVHNQRTNYQELSSCKGSGQSCAKPPLYPGTEQRTGQMQFAVSTAYQSEMFQAAQCLFSLFSDKLRLRNPVGSIPAQRIEDIALFVAEKI